MSELALTTRLAIYFARNPEESLRRTDIRKKFGVASGRSFAASIEYAQIQGLIERDPTDRQVAWRPGPALRRELPP